MYKSERAAKLVADKAQSPTVIKYVSGQNKGEFDWLSERLICDLRRSGGNDHYHEIAQWNNMIPPKWINCR